MSNAAAHRLTRPDRRRGGQVLILTLIAITLLVGLVFYAYNVGDQVNKRLEMQGAADAVATAGGGWMARNMNVVAMDNVGMAKLLSLVPVLDTQPLATEMAYKETRAWAEGLEMLRQQADANAVDPTVSPATEAFLKRGLYELHRRMEEQADILEPYNQMLNDSGFNMEETTHWAHQGGGGGVPHGSLWRAAVTLEELSRSAIESCGELAQARASGLGERDNATTAFLVPVKPEMPAREGTYVDFLPTLRGRLQVESNGIQYSPTGGRGGAIPDVEFHHRLGPWARLHRWRDYIRRFITTGRQWIPGQAGRGQTRGQGNVNVGGRRVGRSARQPTDNGRPGRWQNTGYSELLGYRTYGPYEWAKRHIHHWARGTHENPGKLRDTYYYSYVSEISKIKLDYMFPPTGFGAGTPTRSVHFPDWRTNYPECVEIGEDPANRVTSTLCYLVEIASKYPEGGGGWLSAGTFRTNAAPPMNRPIAMWMRGWNDPAKWGVPQVSNYVWRDSYVYETTQDSQLGIPRELDGDGNEVWHPVYMNAWYIFGGIDVGGEREVSNPANYDDDDTLPIPFLIDTERGEYSGDDPDVGTRREAFMYLGVAKKLTEAPIWPARFSHANPLEGMMTVAQAKVFNNKSWGLWTQDWRVQLAPVTGWQDWVQQLSRDIAIAPQVPSVDPDEVQTAYDYLSALDADMARMYLCH